jgi:hypothetical protein
MHCELDRSLISGGRKALPVPTHQDQIWDRISLFQWVLRPPSSGAEATGAWNWQCTSICCRVHESVELISIPLFCFHDVVFRHRDNFTFNWRVYEFLTCILLNLFHWQVFRQKSSNYYVKHWCHYLHTSICGDSRLSWLLHTVTGLWPGRPRNNSSIPDKGKSFIFSPQRPPSSGAHPIQYTQGALSPGAKRPDVKLFTHLHLGWRLRTHWAIHQPPLPHVLI